MTLCPYTRAVTAVTSDNPRADYLQMAPMQFQAQLQSWVAASPLAVREALNNRDLGVRPTGEPIPTFLLNTPAQSIFGALVRMQDGGVHPQLKAAIRQALAGIDEILIQQTTLTVAREIAPCLPD